MICLAAHSERSPAPSFALVRGQAVRELNDEAKKDGKE